MSPGYPKPINRACRTAGWLLPGAFSWSHVLRVRTVPPSTLGLDREMVANWFEYWLPSTYLRRRRALYSQACLDLEISFGKDRIYERKNDQE